MQQLRPAQHHGPTTVFGLHNTVDVETALTLRRVTSADADVSRPATAAQLAARQRLLPRNSHSATVIRRKEQLAALKVECDIAKRTETKFQDRVSLVHLGVDLKMDREPVTGVISHTKWLSGGKPPLRSPEKKVSTELVEMFEAFDVAKDAAEAINAVDSLPPVAIAANVYLQHLRSNAEATLHNTATSLVHASQRRAALRRQLHPDHEMTPTALMTGTTSADDIPDHFRAVFEEWDSFLSLLQTRDVNSIDEDVQRDLFIHFMRSRGQVRPEEHTGLPTAVEGAIPSEVPVDQMRTPEPGRSASALDDLAPPSDGLGADPAERAMPAAARATHVIVKHSAPLSRAKMMLGVQGKHEHLVRLMELSMLSSALPPRARTATPDTPAGATHAQSPLRSKLAPDVQQATREVFSQIHFAQEAAHDTFQSRLAEKQQHQGHRVTRSKNIELYRQHQQEKHYRGLSHSTTVTQPTHQHIIDHEDSPSAPSSPLTKLSSGPPSATHKMGSRRGVGSARSRPSSGSTSFTTPRGPTLDLPTIPLRTKPNVPPSR